MMDGCMVGTGGPWRQVSRKSVESEDRSRGRRKGEEVVLSR